MKLVPGETITLYYVSENSDKTEGRGHTIKDWWFEDYSDATRCAKGKGAMGYDESVSARKFFVDSSGRICDFPGREALRLKDILTIEDGRLAVSAFNKLTAEEFFALKKCGLFNLQRNLK